MGNAAGLSRPNFALFALVLLTVSPVAARECPAFGDLTPDETPRLFSQQRHLPSLRAPLLSAGLVQASEDSFVWQVCEPFNIRTIIDTEGISQSVEGEALTQVGPEMLQETIRQISIADIFRGRFEQLGTVFGITLATPRMSDGRWQVSLVPRSDPISSIIDRIDVAGCRAVNRVSILYRAGGRDDIRIGEGVTMVGPAHCPAR